jgi:hypothetical protein|tara:strand:+ start:49 stop:456 length:408 start_codon:yes stop_codon:yes gene_type:complete
MTYEYETYEYDESVKYEDDKEWESYLDPLSYSRGNGRLAGVQITDMVWAFECIYKKFKLVLEGKKYSITSPEGQGVLLVAARAAAEILLEASLRGIAFSVEESDALKECATLGKNELLKYKDDFGPPEEDTSTWD